MGVSSSIPVRRNKYKIPQVYPNEKGSFHNVSSSPGKEFLRKDESPAMSLEAVMNRMKCFQNRLSSDVLYVFDPDSIKDVLNVEPSEWKSVKISEHQDDARPCEKKERVEDIMNQMKCYQNEHTCDVMYVFGDLGINEVPSVIPSEWFEVGMWKFQSVYNRQTKQSSNFKIRQLFGGEGKEKTASVSSDSVSSELEGDDDSIQNNFEDDRDEISVDEDAGSVHFDEASNSTVMNDTAPNSDRGVEASDTIDQGSDSLISKSITTVAAPIVADIAKSMPDMLQTKAPATKSICLESFTVGNILNTGSFASVHLAKHKTSGELYALKVMKRDFLREQQMEHQIERECHLNEHTTLHPDHFLQHFLTEVTPDHICLVMEYVSTGDCFELMKSMPDGRLPHLLVKHIVGSLIQAISFLHDHGVVHRDVKPDNVMITPNGGVKLVDFGMATHHHCGKKYVVKEGSTVDDDASYESLWLKDFGDHTSSSIAFKDETDISLSSFRFDMTTGDGDMLNTLVGNVDYAAPEVLSGEGYDHMIDWWALGILFFHLLAGIPPFHGRDDSKTKYNVIVGRIKWKVFPRNIPPSYREFIVSVLKQTPANRLGTSGDQELREHALFEGTDFSEVLKLEENVRELMPRPSEVVFEEVEDFLKKI